MSALLGCVDPGDGVRADFEPVQVFGKQFRKCRAALTVLGGRRFEKLPSRIGKKVIPEFLRGIAEVVGNDGEQLGDHLLQYDGPGEDGIHDVLVRGHDDSPVDPFAVYQDTAQPPPFTRTTLTASVLPARMPNPAAPGRPFRRRRRNEAKPGMRSSVI